ncbi:hypothetical protein ZIOFF_001998 [Zingiber officinale]|uniref:Uncharacterized protein n=1 Tax=Zingiber officinale TaxID=94328 RepID=A0A8J5IAT5_ZINOF|nr:hypothetical protein ZIOFF_001998 [Zingiber officinale]
MVGRHASDNGNGQSHPRGVPVAGDCHHLGFLHEIEGCSLDPARQRRLSLPTIIASSDERRSISDGRSQPKPSSPASSSSSSKRKEKKKAAIKKALFPYHGPPAALSGIPLIVHWRRAADPTSNSISTSPARVVSGVVQFEETLSYRCAVQGNCTGPGGTAKYEARHFLIYSSLAGGAPGLDLGRHLHSTLITKFLYFHYEIPLLPTNPTMAQIKVHKEKKMKKSKAKACLFAAVSATIFSRIMSLQTAKEIWDYLKSEYEGDERIHGMQVLNLFRDFEMQKMKKTETIKEYADRLLGIANRVRLLGSSLIDSRIVEKILVTLPERFEATITTFENTKDLTRITLAELLNALQAQEPRRAMRREGEIEGALPARHNDVGNFRKQKNKNPQAIGEGSLMGNKNKAGDKKAGAKVNYPPSVICKNKNPQQEEEAKVADQDEDQLFVATCFASNVETESWLIDSGCTNHMTNDKELFKDLHPTKITKRDKLDRKAAPGIFIGYSNVSKAYKVFQPQTGNIIVSRDVYFMENEAWNWEDTKKKNQTVTDLKFKFSSLNTEDEEGLQDEAVDDVPVRGTRLLSDIYER